MHILYDKEILKARPQRYRRKKTEQKSLMQNFEYLLVKLLDRMDQMVDKIDGACPNEVAKQEQAAVAVY